MPEISPIRLAEIFRSLSSTTKRTEKKKSRKSHEPEPNRSPEPVRDKTVLKEKLIKRLEKLDRDKSDYIEDASLITIQEIIIWEFGNEILNHPEFKIISSTIANNIVKSPELNEHMSLFISEALSDN